MISQRVALPAADVQVFKPVIFEYESRHGVPIAWVAQFNPKGVRFVHFDGLTHDRLGLRAIHALA